VSPLSGAAQSKLVSIIIPSLHRPDLTRRCLESIRIQGLKPEEWEVVVVENEAREGAILGDPLPANTRRIQLTENLGTTGSINCGILATASEFVLLLNNDVELGPQFLQLLLGALRDERYGFATGKLLQAQNPAFLDGAGDALIQAGAAYRLGHNTEDLGQFDEPRSVLAGCGAATLFRRVAFNEAGGLDEDFFAYLDDVDLGLRVQMMGYRSAYVPQAIAYHVGSATLGNKRHPLVLELLTRNQILLVVKNYPASILLRLLPKIVLFQFLWFCLLVREGEFLSYVRGILGALRRLPHTFRNRRRLMKSIRITNEVFANLLCDSEKQVREWHLMYRYSDPARSKLLDVYFGGFW